jgi:hypothetical protein
MTGLMQPARFRQRIRHLGRRQFLGGSSSPYSLKRPLSPHVLQLALVMLSGHQSADVTEIFTQPIPRVGPPCPRSPSLCSGGARLGSRRSASPRAVRPPARRDSGRGSPQTRVRACRPRLPVLARSRKKTAPSSSLARCAAVSARLPKGFFSRSNEAQRHTWTAHRTVIFGVWQKPAFDSCATGEVNSFWPEPGRV